MTNDNSTQEVVQEIALMDAQQKLATIKAPEMMEKAKEEMEFEIGYTELALTGGTGV